MGGDFFSDVADAARGIRDIINRVASTIGEAIWNFVWVLPRFLSDFWNRLSYVGDFLGDRLRWLVDTTWNGVKWVAETLQNRLSYIGDMLADRLRWLVQTTWDGLSWVARNVWDGAVWAANRIWDGIAWAGTTLYNGVVWAGQKAYDGALWAANRVWDGLSYVAGKVWDGLSYVAGKVWDGLSWAGTKLYDGIVWTGNRVYDGITWATAHIWDGASGAVDWVWEHYFSAGADDVGDPLQYVKGLFHAIETLPDLFDSLPAVGSFRSPVARWVLGILIGMAALVTVPSNLAVVYSMRLHQEAAAEAGAALMSQSQLRDAFRRNIDPGDPVASQLRRYGYDVNKVQALMALWDELPTPTDLVRFGVREVFTPEIAERFGQFEDFPAAFASWMKQLGFSDFWSRAYWGAHWDLPSVTAGYEMFHRDVIDRATLELLLRAQDVMPFWRDKVIEIAYNPINRIDLRRMFRAGSLTPEQVLRGYLDLGYSPTNAERITDWVTKDAAGVEKSLPSSAILRAYRKRLLDPAATVAALEDLDLDAESIDLLLALEDLAIAEERADLVEDVVRKDYKAGTITAAAAASALTDLGVPADRVALLIDLWTVEKAPRTVTLSASEVQRALRERVISEADARGRLAALGYNEADVTIKVRLSTPEEAAQEARELTVAQLQASGRRQVLASFLAALAALDDLVDQGLASQPEIEALHGRLVARGYGEEDAWRLTLLAWPEPEAPGPPRERTLTAAQDLRAFRDGLIDLADLQARLRALGYPEEDITILILETLPPGG